MLTVICLAQLRQPSLTDSGNIHSANALQLDWLEVCPPPTTTRNRQRIFDLATIVDVHGTETVIDHEAKTFIVGNPPYVGARKMTDAQKADVRAIADRLVSKWTNLDYVAGWFISAYNYARAVSSVSFAFVATNSLCQGQQVQLLARLSLQQLRHSLRASFVQMDKQRG